MGFIQHQVTLSGESLYQTLEQDQHCLTCLQCGESFPIQGCPVQKLEQELQTSYSFRIYYHTLEFFGLCDPCAQLQG
jgi:Fur family ferric uptake transcriptional regulator